MSCSVVILHFSHNRYSHVLDGTTEGVCDAAIVDGFLTQAKVSEFNVALRRKDLISVLNLVSKTFHSLCLTSCLWKRLTS